MDIEAEYNNRARVPEHPDIFAGWARDAAARRSLGRAELGLPYAPGARNFFDIFYPERDAGLPVVSFIHGGYWRSLEPRQFSHVATGLNARGYVVAMPGYDLCPQVSIATIIEQTRMAHLAIWRLFRRPIVATGHSAGGHLAACMLATDWNAIDNALPRRLVPAAYAISGLFDLAPLLGASMNADLHLDAQSAYEASPLYWTPPAGLALDAVAGAQESSEFIRNSRVIAETWAKGGVATRFGTVPGANHFNIIAPLADPDSAMTDRIDQLAGRRPAGTV